jgi:hypothetical protein
MEILPLSFMQAAVLKWNTCTTKCKTHPDKKLKMEILSLLFMSYQCTRHTMMHDHRDASMSIDSEFTSPNKLPVGCNLTDIISMHGGVHKLKEAKICEGIPNYHQVHFLFSTSARPRPKLPSFFVDVSVKRNKNEIRTKNNSGPLYEHR